MILIQNLAIFHLKNSNQVLLSWTASTTSGVTYYRIYKSASPYGPFTLVTSIPLGTETYTDTIEIIPINIWYYKVCEYNGVENGPVPTYGQTFIDETTWETSPFTQTTAPNLYPTNVDMNFYFEEIKRRNLWMLENDGEWVKLLKRRYEGTPCPLINTEDGSDQCAEPTGTPACYGTGFVGGFYTTIDMKVRRAPNNNIIKLQNMGFRLDAKIRMWTVSDPRVDTGDIIVDQMNRRYIVLSVLDSTVRGRILHYEFEVDLLPPRDIIYQVPI